MKTFFAIALLSAVPLAFTQPTADAKTTKKAAATKTAAKKTAAKKTNAAQPLSIPAEAVHNPDGTYSYTDKSGRKWIYVKSPFGISRTEDPSAATGAPAAPSATIGNVTAVDKGETVTFQRRTPFGATTWEKKKSELTGEEKQILESQSKSNPE
ncbi:MAG: hypothetical protein KGN84_14040 [Acidobacteriota bacterium]|nr:hypothetical protein [Acidobacteriota bacterium]